MANTRSLCWPSRHAPQLSWEVSGSIFTRKLMISWTKTVVSGHSSGTVSSPTCIKSYMVDTRYRLDTRLLPRR